MTVSVSSKYGRALTAYDNLSAEYDIANFLAAFCLLSQPRIVVETGTYLGETAHKIHDVLEHPGKIYTCDIEDRAQYCLDELSGWMEFRQCKGIELIESLSDIDIAFLDSGGNGERHREALALRGRLSPLAWVFLHDALNADDPCYWKIAEDTGWPSVILPYGRGLAMFCIGQEHVKATIPQSSP